MENLRINQLMDIVIEGDTFREYYPVRIENIDEQSLFIGMPMKQGGIIRLQIGQEIRCVFRNGNQYYTFSTIVTGLIKNPIPMLITDRPTQLSKINQKRAYVRIEVVLPIEYRLLGDSDDDLENDREIFYKGQTVNVSAGGVLLSTDVRLEPRQLMEIKLYIPNYDPFCSKARVLRIFDKVDFRRKNIWAAIQYMEISDAKRDKLFNYIFEKERELINKAYKQ